MSTAKHIHLGKEGEEAALQFYLHRGYQLAASNWRYEKLELDLIVRQDNWLVFVEVKTRSGSSHGHPEKAVNKKKQQNLITAANIFCEEIDWQGEVRFDILSIIKKPQGFSFHQIEDAISPY